jgi:hypothetical protein
MNKKVKNVLGRLPSRYRITIWIAGLLTFSAAGAWLAFMTPVPLVWSSGAVVGAALGTFVVARYVHLLEDSAGGRPAPGNR